MAIPDKEKALPKDKKPLDFPETAEIGYLRMEKHSTRQAAKKLKLSMATLNKYIANKMIPVPPLIHVGTVSMRLWSDKDIEKVQEILPKIANGRKHRKRKSKKTNQ